MEENYGWNASANLLPSTGDTMQDLALTANMLNQILPMMGARFRATDLCHTATEFCRDPFPVLTLPALYPTGTGFWTEYKANSSDAMYPFTTGCRARLHPLAVLS